MTDEDVPTPGWSAFPGASTPADDAYGRVTNPERFLPLHQFARDLIAELVDRYDADFGDGSVDDFDERMRPRIEDVVRVWPNSGEGGPIIVGFTSFPGLIVRLGHWHNIVSPGCGCDACDEQVVDEQNAMRDHVDAYVNGRLVETLDHNRLGFSVVSPNGNRSGWSLVSGANVPNVRQPFEHAWPAWPRRAR